MSQSRSPAARCPVPPEQQPLNEYEAMREAWLFRWATLPWPSYLLRLGVIWAIAISLTGPVAATSFPPHKGAIQFALSAAGGAAAFVVLVLLRLYSGWRYVQNRLNRATVIYEESGWYDGQEWTKHEEMLTRDRLVANYQVQPLIDRLHQTFGLLAIATVLGLATWILA